MLFVSRAVHCLSHAHDPTALLAIPMQFSSSSFDFLSTTIQYTVALFHHFLHISLHFYSPLIHDASLLFNTCPRHFHSILFLHSTLTFPVVHHNSLPPLLFCLPIRHPTMTILAITVQLFIHAFHSSPFSTPTVPSQPIYTTTDHVRSRQCYSFPLHLCFVVIHNCYSPYRDHAIAI